MLIFKMNKCRTKPVNIITGFFVYMKYDLIFKVGSSILNTI